jgi:hypothetical protein
MAVIALLANGILQQLIQPIAYGAALGIHPLAVLVVTIAGGSLFGGIGLILAAPLTSAVVKISSDLASVRAAGSETAEEADRRRPRTRRRRTWRPRSRSRRPRSSAPGSYMTAVTRPAATASASARWSRSFGSA